MTKSYTPADFAGQTPIEDAPHCNVCSAPNYSCYCSGSNGSYWREVFRTPEGERIVFIDGVHCPCLGPCKCGAL